MCVLNETHGDALTGNRSSLYEPVLRLLPEGRWRRNGLLEPAMCLDLPSEAEWERAARGEDGRIYPWGNTFDGNRLNWYGHMLMAPAPMGSFPTSAGPYGAEEMVGNLWEWTRSTFEPYGSNYCGGTILPMPSAMTFIWQFEVALIFQSVPVAVVRRVLPRCPMGA